MADKVVKITFRMKRHLHAKLVAAARSNGVSLNSEICNRLKKSFSENVVDDLWLIDLLPTIESSYAIPRFRL